MNKISENKIDFSKEWETSRAILSFFDGKLYDLRKYGFSFITALISTEGLLVSYFDPNKIWPDDIKFAILFVTILMILGLTIIDRTFSVIQLGACHRARILERIMNFELSEIIASRYSGARLPYFIIGLYAIFIGAVMCLGSFIIDRSGIYYWLLIVTGILAIIMVGPILRFIRPDASYGSTDWRVDRLRYAENENVEITLTNLGRIMGFYASEDKPLVMWEVRKEEDNTLVSGNYGIIRKNIRLEPGSSYTWIWPTDNFSGVYRVYRRTFARELIPMRRSITIVKEKEKSKPEPTLVKLIK